MPSPDTANTTENRSGQVEPKTTLSEELYDKAVKTLQRANDMLGLETTAVPTPKEITQRLDAAIINSDTEFRRSILGEKDPSSSQRRDLTTKVLYNLNPRATKLILEGDGQSTTVYTLERVFELYPPRRPTQSQKTLSWFLFKRGGEAYIDKAEDRRSHQFMKFFTDQTNVRVAKLVDRFLLHQTNANIVAVAEGREVMIFPPSIPHQFGRRILGLPMDIVQHWLKRREPFPAGEPFEEDLYYITEVFLDELDSMNAKQVHHILSGKYRFEQIYSYRKPKPVPPQYPSVLDEQGRIRNRFRGLMFGYGSESSR